MSVSPASRPQGKNRRMMPQVPSDFMSFSTFYNKDATTGGRRKQGARKITCFELMSFITGRNMSSIFDIRGKKKDITLPSPFPKKKQPFRIGFTPGPETAGSHQ